MESESGQPDQAGVMDEGFQSPSNRRHRSKVWDEFTQIAECNHCKQSFSGKSSGGTSHLHRHLQICRARPATRQLPQPPQVNNLNFHQDNNMNFDRDRFLEFLTKALISNLCTSLLTSSTNLRQFLAGICPIPGVVSEAAIENRFRSIFQNGKLKLKEQIKQALGGVFLSLARWNLDSKCFVCVTVHFIDKDWNMMRKIIQCKFVAVTDSYEADFFAMFEPSHNAIVVEFEDRVDAAELVIKAVQNWSFEGKLSGISLPSSLEDTGMDGGLQKFLKEQDYLLDRYKLLMLPCIIDFLHDLLDCKSTFAQASKSWFAYMTCSQLRREKYNEILAKLQMKRPGFGSKNWYMIFYLLEVALQFNRELPNPAKIDNKLFPPSACQFDNAENFCNVARLIYQAISYISNPCNATLNLHFHVIWSLRFDILCTSRDASLDHAINIQRMHNKFDELWGKWYLWLSLAVVLDPRYKFKFLDSCFTQAFGNGAKRYIHEVRGKMYYLFLQYSCYVDHQTDYHLNRMNNDLHMDMHGSMPVHDTALSYMDELTELIGYLESELIPQNANFDILKWWKDNAFIYPTLARLACDILVIPGCAVSAESAFHENDLRVSLFNPEMSPDKVEALICTQNWISSSEK